MFDIHRPADEARRRHRQVVDKASMVCGIGSNPRLAGQDPIDYRRRLLKDTPYGKRMRGDAFEVLDRIPQLAA